MAQRLTSLIVVCGFLVGCGGGEEAKIPPLAPVSGTVKMDGKPLQGAVLSFLPKGATAGHMVTAVTDAEGKFACQYSNGAPGCPAGEYQVLISKLLTPDGKPIPEGSTAADVGAVETIPMRYRDPEAPSGSVMIPQGGKTDLNYDLKSK